MTGGPGKRDGGGHSGSDPGESSDSDLTVTETLEKFTGPASARHCGKHRAAGGQTPRAPAGRLTLSDSQSVPSGLQGSDARIAAARRSH
eukprot:472308-Hanusia_phi.AAC.1